MSGERSEAAPARREIVVACLAALVLLTAGVFANAAAVKRELKYQSLFFEQFAAMEMPAVAVTAVFVIGIVLIAVSRRRSSVAGDDVAAFDPSSTAPRWALPALLGVVGLIIVFGFVAAFHRYYIADDEYSAWFQAQIFARGRWTATVPPNWCGFITAITPTTISVPKSCTWELAFLPGHSAVRAPFLILHADWLAGPVIAALSLLLLFSIARKLWPDRPERAWLSIAILAASTQFLFMSMTMFSMSTHLLFALVWLWLYVDDRPWAIALLPVASFCELGAHSPTPHVFWVGPFVLRYALHRRWLRFLYVSAGIAVAGVLWAKYLGLGAVPAASQAASTVNAVSSVTAAAHGAAGVFLTRRWDPFVTAMDLTLVATWSSPLVIVVLIIGMLSWTRLDGVVRTCVVSLVLTIVLRALTGALQGEGFGYRFVYDNLGQIALISVLGIDVLARATGRLTTRRILVVSGLVTLLVQLPMRLWQVERLAAPWARTYAWLTTRPAKVVVFNPGDVMWGRQMLRNDPFFERGPVLVSEPELPKDGLAKLRAIYPGQVRVVSKSELLQFGLEKQPLMFGSLRVGE